LNVELSYYDNNVYKQQNIYFNWFVAMTTITFS